MQTNAGVPIPKTAILVNDPSKVTFVVPAILVPGDYKLTICTQFSKSGKPLKEARSCTFEYALNVSD